MMGEEEQMAASFTIDLLIGPQKRWTPSGNLNNLKQFLTSSPSPFPPSLPPSLLAFLLSFSIHSPTPTPSLPPTQCRFSPLTKHQKFDKENGQLHTVHRLLELVLEHLTRQLNVT